VTIRRLKTSLGAVVAIALAGGAAAFQFGNESGRVAALENAVPRGQWLTATDERPTKVDFDDGSSLSVEQAGRARVQYVEERGGLVHLDRGVARLSVEHHDGSTWRVAAGPYEVEAIGTEFTVDWVEGRVPPLRVDVSEGTVAVRGPGVDGDRYVSQNQSVELSPPEPETAKGTSAMADVPSAANDDANEGVAKEDVQAIEDLAAESSDSVPSKPGAAAIASWRTLEAEGKYVEAIRAAEQVGFSKIQNTADPDAMLSLARAGRLSGRTDVASAALDACRRRFGGSRQAAMAAFLLGRASHGATAARWFETYLEEQPGGNLAREALGRLIEAYQASGSKEAAVRTARQYLKRYPTGPHAELARRAVGE
jgi:hypothetical protein